MNLATEMSLATKTIVVVTCWGQRHYNDVREPKEVEKARTV